MKNPFSKLYENAKLKMSKTSDKAARIYHVAEFDPKLSNPYKKVLTVQARYVIQAAYLAVKNGINGNGIIKVYNDSVRNSVVAYFKNGKPCKRDGTLK